MITVTISRTRLADLGQDVHRGVFVLKCLRQHGIPALGSIWPTGVSEGTLNVRMGDGPDAMVYEWDGEMENLA
jgi:hypothetical protein